MAELRIYDFETIDRLPPLCMQCGAETDSNVRRRFSWYDPRLNILLLLLGPIGHLTIQNKKTWMIVNCPMCERHRNHWTKRMKFTWLGLLSIVCLGGIFLALGDALDPKDVGDSFEAVLGLSWIFIFSVYLIAVVIYTKSAIQAKEITDFDITLTRLSPDFVEAFYDRCQRLEEDRERRRLEDNDDYSAETRDDGHEPPKFFDDRIR